MVLVSNTPRAVQARDFALSRRSTSTTPSGARVDYWDGHHFGSAAAEEMRTRSDPQFLGGVNRLLPVVLAAGGSARRAGARLCEAILSGSGLGAVVLAPDQFVDPEVSRQAA